MSMKHASQETPGARAEEETSSELVGQIRKLRWIGMEAEAQPLETRLCRMRVTDVVVGTPQDTD
ncbi:hypothetical protein HW532_00950 [Kaustia mangrovi]|uniref:Uncharacterized protein n=1 Tax=Kaustia mangrovi TaxID=2593653 RepID=A0A7S8HAC6_9HYPH|nr:hypothetical protein [Kaustia mangrovi]QPC41430.1 hypothetical protein HW532_00950 [Kaustia mangrovi]